MSPITSFFVGLLIGTLIGMFVSAMCHIAGESDARTDQMDK
jgi:hypothetical protein